MHGRTIEVKLSEEFGAALKEGGLSLNDPRLQNAIGYLGMWGFCGRATLVQIYGNRYGEMTARYTDENGKYVFTIGAVPDDNWNYSFHS